MEQLEWIYFEKGHLIRPKGGFFLYKWDHRGYLDKVVCRFKIKGTT